MSKASRQNKSADVDTQTKHPGESLGAQRNRDNLSPNEREQTMSNIQTAKALAAAHSAEWDQYDRLPQPATGWVGEDSDFPTRYWRIGGNAVVVQGPFGLEAKRWHEIVTETRGLRYRAR